MQIEKLYDQSTVGNEETEEELLNVQQELNTYYTNNKKIV